ncbi:MAG: hypothetical protein H0W68_01590 [Gemmatimonadaceae bacterium]|nr:hypothetical protein [Gemmatimonadaceae bacterium]
MSAAGRELSCAVLPLSAAALPLTAQGGWKNIGRTSSGNAVFVDPRTVKRAAGLVSATVRIVFTTPVKVPNGVWGSSKTTATFDCGKRSLAAKENIFYADARGTKVVQRVVNKQPGFGPALGGSLGGVALDYLCSRS